MTAAAPSQPKQMPRWWRRFILASRRANVFLVLEIVAAIAFLAMIATTWLAFTSAPPNGQLLPSSQVALLLLGTLIPAMALLVLFGRRLAIRRAAGSTARLHVRLVFFFSLVAAIPTLLVAAFAGILFQAGVDFWFSGSSRSLMDNANELARGYYEQNQLQVANETIAMASDMRFSLERVTLTDAKFPEVYQYQLQARELNESAILQLLPDGQLRTAAFVDLREGNEPAKFAATALSKLDAGEAVAVNGDATRIEALAPIDRNSGVYLYNARNSDSLPFNQWERAKAVVEGYNVLTGRARALQLRFNLALFVVSLGLVGLAVWFALRFADRQVEPLTDLVAAARKVGAGNFSLRVEGRTGADEIGMLNRAFNRMTAQLEKQTDALVGANQELDERRTFIEAVLESITAGIISLDHQGRVLLMNSRAHELLLSGDEKSPVGKDIQDFAPQIGVLVEAGLQSGVVSASKGGELLTLAVQVAQASEGSVITFEDITRQLLDQRQAAWSDVARRIAHEIKNPLTPIQLATERLKRRYRTQIEKDGELFDELTSTIVRQVGDLRKMVDEFSSFARLPKPNFRQEDALDIVRQAMFLQEVAHSEVNYRFKNLAGEEVRIACDRHQLGQAMTNILKNAFEAVEAKAKNAEPDYRGAIAVELSREGDMITIAVEDNGIGLPQDRESIIEPYVTTREKGTGLGLAIVNKIVEEHGGDITFSTGSNGGSRVTMRFARDPRISPEQGHA
ncbi:MAG: HAMP domain-containing protein [Sphingomonadaceae bacterium]|nr:HAMP domain-containing protein [Sphingomonadaceae bacterium]